MQIARVVGTVVSTTKSDRLTGLKMLLVKPIDLETFEEKGNVLVAFDALRVFLQEYSADRREAFGYFHYCDH